MNTVECIKTRRTIRKFTDEVPSKEVLTEIVSAAAFAPSWKNTRTPRWNIITDRAVIEEIAEKGVFGFEHNGGIIRGCSCLVIQSCFTKRCGYERDGSYSTAKEDGWEMYDAGIAAQTFCLAAHENGLGTVIMGIIDYDKIAEIIKLPEEEIVMAAIAVGYPAEAPAAPPKYTAEEITRFI